MTRRAWCAPGCRILLPNSSGVATSAKHRYQMPLCSAHFTDDVSAGRTVRLIYHGQMLQDDSRSLASYGIRDDSTVHCHVSHGPRRRACKQKK